MDSHLAIVMAMFFVGLLATLCFTVLKYGIRNEWPLFEALMRDEAKRTETLKTLDIGVYMCVWICSSVAFTMFNKFVFSVFDGGKISYPMIMCATQYAFKWAFSAVYLKCYEGKIDPGPGKPMDYLLLYVPIGLSSSLDLILSNEAMKRISVSAYTVLKSTGLIYVYFISVALGLKSFHFNTLACVMAMVLGMAAVVWGYMGDSSHFGLVAVTAASLVGALRWSYIESVMKQNMTLRSQPIALIYRISPAGLALSMTCGAIFELPHLAHSEDIGGKIIGEMFVASLLLGVAALLFIALEFQLISMTSALSFSVMGTFKEVLQITLAFLILHNRLTVVKALGIAVVLIAVAAYHRIQLQLHSQQPSPPASELGSLADTNDGKSGHVSGSGYVRRDIHNPNGKPDATYKPVRALETELEVFDELELSTGIFDDYGNYASYLSSDPSKGTAPSPK